MTAAQMRPARRARAGRGRTAGGLRHIGALMLLAALVGACAESEPVAGASPAAPEASAAPAAPAEAAAPAARTARGAATGVDLPPPDPAGPRGPSEAGPPATPTRAAPAPSVPPIYVALQPAGAGRPVSVVFAIDEGRDGTPSNDPAIRLSPEDGRCNPQELRYFEFPRAYAERPVVGEAEAAAGLQAGDLPRFLAARVTEMMLAEGLAAEPEETRPQNVCTRKLWEALVAAENRAGAPLRR